MSAFHPQAWVFMGAPAFFKPASVIIHNDGSLMRHAGIFLAGLGALTLAGCAQTVAPTGSAASTGAGVAVSKPTVTMPQVVSALQSFWSGLEADAAAWEELHPADAATIAAIEAAVGPEIAALAQDPAPTSISNVVTDVQNAIDALPATMLSEAHKNAFNNLAVMAQVLLLISDGSAHPSVKG